MSSGENTFLGKFVMRMKGVLGVVWLRRMCWFTSTSVSVGLNVCVSAPPPNRRICACAYMCAKDLNCKWLYSLLNEGINSQVTMML